MKRGNLAIVIGFCLGLVFFSLFLLVYPFVKNISFIPSENIIIIFLIVTCVSLLSLCLVLFNQFRRERHKIQVLDLKKNEVENMLHENLRRFEILFEYTNLGIAILNLEGRLLKVNRSLCELLGYAESDLLSMNFYSLLHPVDLNNLQDHIQKLLTDKIKVYQSEQQCFRRNGDTLWIMSTLSLIRDNQGKPIQFIVGIQNITSQKNAEERLRHMAYHDPLTGLANRNKLEQFISHMLASARRHQQEFALLFLDLDRLKTINDTIGHEAGDILLQIIAERLRNIVRSTDMVSRVGGDEFVVLVTDVKKSESVALIAQKILENVMKVIMVKGQEIYITTSIGISIYPHDGQNIQTLMKNADLALYRSKEQGRNNYQFYTSEMTTKAQEKLALQNALGHALVKNEFLLHYQPKMNLKTRHITGLEALLRWKNQEYAAITPEEIIALAEDTGLIIPVSEWVLKTACQQLKVLHELGFSSLTIAVNCSARQFKQATFVDDVLKVITEVGIPPQALEIEVTESTIMQDPENTLRILYGIKDLGVRIDIDDFGTGYWSLNNLRRLAIDKIKIDKTFIKQVALDETSAAIVRAIIAMSNKLGICSVAEGVETKEQYEFLIKEGCTEIQGYYLTQPLTAEGIIQFLRHPIPDAEAITKSITME